MLVVYFLFSRTQPDLQTVVSKGIVVEAKSYKVFVKGDLFDMSRSTVAEKSVEMAQTTG